MPAPRQKAFDAPSPPSSFVVAHPPKMTQQVRLRRRMKTQTLMRTRSGATGDSGDEIYAQTPILELLTPLNTVCLGWTPAEIQAGRRLVRFSKVQDGRRLIVSCETVSQEEYCEQDNVISCIYQEGTETCFVTSVDVIYLLERLTNDEFPVEEKNRIRRNLEGLRPTTVSKHKQGYEEFFQRIMEFPDPKPRNIEKDLKVFKWNLLGQALEKILSKYSIFTTTMTESSEAAPSDTLSEISDSVVPRFPYSPPESLDQPFPSHVAEPEWPNIWCSEYKASTIGPYDDFGNLGYNVVDTMPTSAGNYSEGASYELAPYDLPFSDMAEHAVHDCYM
ncbi:hypothetical protein M378DRAFT_841984 [Amanita muscaria Koide BX008]|uniref:DUF7082 domain-containing protein n=1 Tax=Amanita muscaria (strain Koide BX008) TaxID=946122 RepID=A0A0C2X411_AMAMK|nr:hypothetical protein M378DRAFT_841984 [Amanita muscaria Koide BX008]